MTCEIIKGMDPNSLSEYQFKHSSIRGTIFDPVPKGTMQPQIDLERNVEAFHNGKSVGVLGVTRFHDDGFSDEAAEEGVYEDAGIKAPKWGYPTIDINQEHRGKGLATAMWRSLGAQIPNDSIRHHVFHSEEGLALAKKMTRENPKQHILLEGDDELHPGYE
jgi:hypothetical protein